ncbi:MAG TPA: DUF4402 domain-containing protein [Bacteroidales bacterium]
MKKIILFSFLVAGFAISSFGQVTATATASATIVSPIAITKTVDMNFGNVAVSTTAGTVVLAPAGTRTSTGGVTLPATTGTVAAAAFTVTGQAGYTYAITLPSTDYTITRATGTETMIVNTFTSNPSATGTLTGGTSALTVGATLNVGGSQVAGSYTNATGFPVTVNYN